MRKWGAGTVAALVIGVVSGAIARLLDSEAPYALIGGFWALLAFLVGAAGVARLERGQVDPRDLMR